MKRTGLESTGHGWARSNALTRDAIALDALQVTDPASARLLCLLVEIAEAEIR